MRLRTLALLVTLTLAAACTSDDDATPIPTSTVTATPETTSTAIAEPTLTPTRPSTATPAPVVVPIPAPGTFAPAGPIIEIRSGHTATRLQNGRVLITGGRSIRALGTHDSAELFDPSTGHFEPTGNMTRSRTHHSATLLLDGRVLLTGGGLINGTGITSAELYNPATGTFTPTGDMQFGRWSRTAALLPDGRVLVAGGGANDVWATAELYDAATGTFSRTGDLNVGRFGHTLTTLNDGRVLISGGGPLEIYDLATGQFRLIEQRPLGEFPTATRLLDGRVLLIGGTDLEQLVLGGSNGHGSGPATAEAVIFDPASEQFIPVGSMLAPRQSHAATLLSDGRVLVSGGTQDVHGDLPLLASAEIYDPALDAFAPTDPMIEPRFGHSLTALDDGSVLVIGTISTSVDVHAERYLPPPRETRPVSGLFAQPQPTELDHVRSLGQTPPSPFEPWNREDVILYDTATMTELDLGPGWIGFGAAFSPDGAYFVWTAGPPSNLSEIWLMDLSSGEYELLTSGVAIWWLDDHTIYGREQWGLNENQLLDIRTAEWSDADGVDPNLLPGSDSTEAAGWILKRTIVSDYPLWTSTYRLTNLTGTQPPIEFDAYKAILAPDGTLFVATVPTDARNPLPNAGPHIEAGSTNIFEVDPITGIATYIATAEASAPGWSFDASEGYVAWMDGFCAESELASTIIYNRSSGELTELDALLWFKLTPDGRIASGVFGAHQLIDIETLEYVVVLPDEVSDVAWSPDYRYAAVGFQFGHGGPCG